MDQPRKVAKPARGQLNREIKCPCRCIRIVSTYYVLLLAFVCIPGIFFIWVHVVHSCTVHCYNVCATITAVSVHIMYYECSSTYTVISSGASPPLPNLAEMAIKTLNYPGGTFFLRSPPTFELTPGGSFFAKKTPAPGGNTEKSAVFLQATVNCLLLLLCWLSSLVLLHRN